MNGGKESVKRGKVIIKGDKKRKYGKKYEWTSWKKEEFRESGECQLY
jgi:hypothetical protein